MNTKRFLIASILVGSWAAALHKRMATMLHREQSGINPTCRGLELCSNIPLQRAERFGTREFLTPEEVETDFARQQRMLAAATAREAELVVNPEAPAAGSVGGYNSFWFEGLVLERTRGRR